MQVRQIFIAIFLVFLVSCQLQGPRGAKGTQGPQKVNFRTGTDGLVLSFPQGTFDRLFEGDIDVNLLVEIQNKGSYPQPDDDPLFGYIWVGGFDPNILQLIPEIPKLDSKTLEGKSPINLEGGRSAVLFRGEVFPLPSGTASYKAPIVVTATYLYKTTTSPIVCIDPNPRTANIREKVCDISKYGNIAVSGGQGAPIVVSKVEEEVTSKTIIFRIEIQNSGKGLVIHPDDIAKNPNLGYDWRNLNKVVIEDISVGGIRLGGADCRPSVGDIVQLINNKGFIVCRLKTANIKNEVYTTPLNIELSYVYSSSVRKEIEIIKEVGFR